MSPIRLPEDRPLRIAFVCTGNICRSPLAEALARHHLHAAGLGGRIAVDSYGTHDYHVGQGADRRTVATAKRFGIDLDGHRARQVTPRVLRDTDLVFAMDSGHYDILHRMLPGGRLDHVHLFLPWAGLSPPIDVPDPYYGGEDGFVSVHRMLDEATRRLAAWLAGEPLRNHV